MAKYNLKKDTNDNRDLIWHSNYVIPELQVESSWNWLKRRVEDSDEYFEAYYDIYLPAVENKKTKRCSQLGTEIYTT